MKRLKTTLLMIAMLLCNISVSAQQGRIEVDGIYYSFWYTVYGDIFDFQVTFPLYDYDNDYTGDVIIPERVEYNGSTYPVTGIMWDAFKDCPDLTSVTIPNSIMSIGSEAFSGCSGLTSITIPNSVTNIEDKTFYGCTGLTNVAIPNSVMNIGSEAFYGCTNLTSFTIPSSVTEIEGKAFEETGWWNSQPDGIVYMEHFLLGHKGEGTVEAIEIKDGTKIIVERAFSNYSDLRSITIPKSVTSIGEYAFSSCYNLEAVYITDLEAWCKIEFAGDEYSNSNPLSRAQHLYLNGKEVKDLVIPGSVTNIKDYAFSGCRGLTSVTIPSSVTSIGGNAFSDCYNLTAVHITDLEAWCKIKFGKNGYGYVSDPFSCTYNLYLNGKEVKDLVIPDSVTSIEQCVFSGCRGLTSVTIPSSVTSIGGYAFSGCDSLTAVHITDLEAWCKIKFGINEYGYASNPFSGTHNLYLNGEEVKDLVIPNSVASIEEYAFSGCRGLTSVTIPSSVTNIRGHAFSGCTGLTSVIIPNSVTYIEEYAFEDCTNLKTVINFSDLNISKGSSNHGSVGFYADKVINADIQIDDFFFCMDNEGIQLTAYIGTDTDLNLPENYSYSIGSDAFARNKTITNITIPSNVRSIGDNALKGCTSLSSITLGATTPPSVNELGLENQQYFTVKLRVPEGSKAAYQFADGWKKFFNIEEYDPTGIENTLIDAGYESLPIYNLQGVKMTGSKSELPSGIYIQGGKKLIVR